MFKQSICWWCFEGKVAPEALLRAAVEIGYVGIELAGEEHWQMIHDHGLEIASIGGHQSIQAGLNRRDQFERIERELHERLELAVKWNIPNLICFSGSRGDIPDDTGAQITAENLSRLAPAAESAGVTLILELLNSKIDHPDYQCDHTAWAVKVVEQVNSPHVKLLYDIYHMQIMEGDIIRAIQQHHTHFAHYHTAGNPGRNDLDDTQEIHYPGIMRAIAASGYEGYVGQEFIPKGDAIAALRQAFTLCSV